MSRLEPGRPWTWTLARLIAADWGRWLAGFAITLGSLLAAPRLSERLDARGLPGVAIALAVAMGAIAFTLYALWTTIPGRRRRSALMRWAAEHQATFRSDFTLPASLSGVPSLAGLTTEGGVANLTVVRPSEDEVMVFDRWRAAAPGYEGAEWRTMAAVRTQLDVPSVVIQPRHQRLRIGELAPVLEQVRTESTEFETRYRVLGEDRAATLALVDARTMAWLLDRRVDMTYESAGGWVACSTPTAASDELDGLVEAVLAFRGRMPRVLTSFYPRPDPGFGLTRP